MTAGKIHELLNYFETPEAIYRADKSSIEAALSRRIGDRPVFRRADIAALSDKELKKAEAVYNACRDKQIKILTQEHELYPKLLLKLPDPPYVLYAKYAERINLNEHLTLAVVGTRKASRYGLSNAEKLSAILAEQGITVVSGMALGIDGAAHRGAIRGGGKTVAVLAGGVDRPSPPSHAGLMREIIKNGMVLSEYPPGTPSLPQHFPIRNRIISGLSHGSIVVEAPEVSGALITARRALDEGKDVFAIPADITSASSVGSNQLLADGAFPVLGPRDIIQHYEGLYGHVMEKNRPASSGQVEAWTPEIPEKREIKKSKDKKTAQKNAVFPKAVARKAPEGLTKEEDAVYALLSEVPVHIDQLTTSGLAPATLSAALTTLEMKGLVQALPGKQFCLSR
ncbi:MAG: DNA-protecting protein DprA [Ruminococcaceae bacterium]|nr:DNA-protecting protein DprA [Oscillospiraceae bacterium]